MHYALKGIRFHWVFIHFKVKSMHLTQSFRKLVCKSEFMCVCVCFFSKKPWFFPFLFDVSKYKKVKILTPIISNETMQSNSVCTTIIFPLQFCCFIQQRDWQKIGWHVLGWKMSSIYKITTSCRTVPTLSASQFTKNYLFSVFYLGGTWNWNLTAQFYSTTPPKRNHIWQSQHCKCWRVEIVDTICYTQ